MKCPKCGYLGFEPVDRCRNCGYEFSLAETASLPELSIRAEPPALDPLADLAILDAAVPPVPDPAPVSSSSDLPLFGAPLTSDEPLIRRPSPPRPPLAVRRATPEVPRLRSEQPRAQPLELDLDTPIAPSGRTVRNAPAPLPEWPAVDIEGASDDAGLGARLLAVILDLAVLASIDAVVIYFTMQICGITWNDLDILPKAPLIAFLLVQNGGYLVAFTAGGQTLGKMATGIKVVTAGSRSQLDLGRAILRTACWVVLAVPAGLGFLTALFSSDHRGLHDRFARTRVVRG